MAVNARHDGAPDSARDPVLDRLYAEGAREEPPAALDDAIRAAARREVRAGPRRLSALLRTWRTPVSIAAVLVLSASLVMLMREEGTDAFDYAPPPAVPPPDIAAQAPPAAPPLQSAPARGPTPSSRMETDSRAAASTDRDAGRRERVKAVEEDATRQEESKLARAEPPPAPAPEAAEKRQPGALTAPAAPRSRPQENAAIAKEADSGSVAAGRAHAPERAASPSAGALSDAPSRQDTALAKSAEQASRGGAYSTPPDESKKPPAAPPAPKPFAAQRAQPKPAAAPPEPRTSALESRAPPIWVGLERQPPEKWLERIEELRRAGREAETREMLDEFRKRFPDYPLPASLVR